jgi:hypothetical protein
MPPFSERQGFVLPKGIRYRDELPYKMRTPIIDLARQRTGAPWLYKIVRAQLDPYGLGIERAPIPFTTQSQLSVPVQFDQLRPHFSDQNLQGIHDYIAECPWFRVYDVIEAIYQALSLPVDDGTRIVKDHAPQFELQINEYFCYAEIGWQLRNGLITTRGDDAFESTISTAVDILEQAQRPTAAGHIRSAIAALSSRPKPDTSGAVAHATSAVECVLGDVTGATMPLGKYLDKHFSLFHPALRKGLDGIYGYASHEGARHGKEGTVPKREEAEFVLATCAAVCTLLTRKYPI